MQKKNHWNESANYYNADQPLPVIDRQRPGEGYRHLLKKRDIERFIAILPDWNEISRGLNGIVLSQGNWDCDGWHEPGVVHICAWEKELWREYSLSHYEEHRDIFERLGVPCRHDASGAFCCFTEEQARAYQLLHIFLHELRHHHDAMTNRSDETARGEPYAESYARKYMDVIWQRFLREFEI